MPQSLKNKTHTISAFICYQSHRLPIYLFEQLKFPKEKRKSLNSTQLSCLGHPLSTSQKMYADPTFKIDLAGGTLIL
jgi:hypothetical protein